MCARYQARPTEKHLLQMRITLVAKILAGVHLEVCNFWERGLLAGRQKGKRALLFPDSSVSLIAFADADHAGCQDTRRSTSGNSNPVFILKASIPPKMKLDFTTGIYFLGIMATTIEQQVALDKALVPSAQRTMATIIEQQAFLVTADVPDINMQEFWATAMVHQHSIRFKMDTRKHIVDLEAFREMLHISPRILGQYFAELPFKEEILEFLRFFGHSAQIKTLTDVNVNKLYQPWRSFAAVINKAFLVTENVLEIYMQEFWATAMVHQHSIRFKMDTRKHIVDLESFREMLHMSPRVSGQSFAELPFEEKILEFLRFLGHSAQIKTLTDVNVNKLYQPWRSFAAVINKCLTRKSTGFDSLRDDIMFFTIKVVSRHQNTQQYGAILPIELTNEDIKNTKAYKEYYACATGEAAPKPKASARKKKGGSASSTTPPTLIATPTPPTTVVVAPRLSAAAKGKQPARARSTIEPSDVERTEAEQLKIVLRMSKHEMHISQQCGSSIDEGTGSRPGVPGVPSDDSEEELSWNSFDDEDVDEQTKGRDESESEKTDESDDYDDDQDEAEKVNDDNDDKDEISKIGEQEATESDEGDDETTESDRESEDEETREQEEESFDPIPRTPKDNEDDDNNKEDQCLRIGEEERMQEDEEADELYRDVDINQGRGLQLSQYIKDSHMTLTPTHSDGQQESSSTSSFMTNLLNPIIDPVFRFEDRVKFLEDNFSNIPGIVNQLMHQQMPEAVREAVQTQTDRLQDSIQKENDEFLKTIDENMKKIIKEQALFEAYDADKTILDTYGKSTILKRIREDDDQEGPSAGSDRGSKRQREGGEHASASTPSEPATGSAGKSTLRTQSQQLSASESAFTEEPV
nr:hypothetical protein [Tanacetum cinerariifolium]